MSVIGYFLFQTAYNAVYIGDISRAQPSGIAIFKKASIKGTILTPLLLCTTSNWCTGGVL
jgi:hypothetical protein